MATLLTISDIKQIEPNIDEYGISDLSQEIADGQADVFRWLRANWWPLQAYSKYDYKRMNIGANEPNEDLYNASQLTRAAVYWCLGFHIMPKLAKFSDEMDMFERKMDFYRKEASRELDAVMQDGIEYDFDSSGTVTDSEKEPQYYLRLKR